MLLFGMWSCLQPLPLRPQESEDGIDYYTMEFTATNPTYTRHALACLAICNGKLFTAVTGVQPHTFPAGEGGRGFPWGFPAAFSGLHRMRRKTVLTAENQPRDPAPRKRFRMGPA